MAPSPPPTSWALLHRAPSFHDGSVTVDVRSPPATTSVLLPHHHLDGSTPHILAAHKGGAILLAFIKPGGAPPDLAVLTVDKGAATLRTLPPRKPPVHPIARTNAIGFLPTRSSSSSSAHVEYIVAELQTVSDGEGARLISVSTQGGDWTEKELALPASRAHRPWGRDGVLSHAGSLWWSDLSWGLIGCDPLAGAPIMAFVELPPGSALTFAEHPAVEGRRVVTISESRVYYMEINRVGDGASRMKLWALRASAQGTGWEWKIARRVSFAEIWEWGSYARTRLPARLPTLMALSPTDASMMFIELEGHLVALHLVSKKVLWLARHVPGEHLPWEIPRCLTSGNLCSTLQSIKQLIK